MRLPARAAAAPSRPALLNNTAGAPRPTLYRGLRRIDLLLLTVNVVVGAGVFALPGALALHAGGYAVWILLAAFLLVALLALSLAEVASRFDVTGGPQVFAEAAFGPLAGFAVGWLLALSRVAVFGAIASIMLDYAAELFPPLAGRGPRAVALTLFMAALVASNLRGVMRGAGLGNWLTAAKILPLVPLALAGLWLAGWNDLPAMQPVETGALTQALLVALFACFGFEQAAIVAGEMRDPQRDMAPSILGGLAIACTLYLLLVFACFALVPDTAGSRLPLVDAAIALVGPAGGQLMAAAAVLSCAGGLAGLMLVAPRIFYALGERRDLPAALASVHPRYRTPHVAIWVLGVSALLLAVTGTFTYLVTVFVLARTAAYASTAGALLVLRRREGPAPVPMPGGRAIAVAALLASTAILATTSLVALRDVALVLAAGLLLRAWMRRMAPPGLRS